MNISKKFVIPVAFLCGGLIVFFGMQMFFMSRPHAPFGFPPANVSVLKVIKENLPFSVQYPAKVAAYQETQIKALVSGNLIDSPYEAGDYVKEGALLFEIDPTLYQQAFNKAKANYQKAKSNLWQIERTFKRVEKLYKTKSVSLEHFDKAKSAYQMALAGVNIAKAEFDTANTQLDYTKVRAPYDGIVSKSVLSNGDFISPQIGNAFLTTMVQIDKVYVNFAFPSKDYELQQKLMSQGIMKFTNDKLEANVILEDGTELPNVAKVSFIDSYIDTKTQSIRARTEIDNQDKKMLPGNFVRINQYDENQEI